jgi:hypothetical protein
MAVEDARYRLAFDEAVRRVQAQESQLDELRSRSGLMLGVTSAVTSLLGALVLSRSDHSAVLATVGLIIYGVSAIAFGLVIWPRDGWNFQLSAKIIIDGWIEGDNPVEGDEFIKGLAIQMDENAAGNDQKIGPLWHWFELGAALLAAETVVWLIALGVR